MSRILLIEDDMHISALLEETLSREGYAVDRAFSGTEALLFLSERQPDLVLLDLMLPGLSGEELLPHLREIPVIVVSAKADTADKVGLLLDGAVDYVTKPFVMDELLARITVQLRKKMNAEASSILSYHEIRLDVGTHRVSIGDTEIKLTRTEYAILKLLLQNAEQVVAKLTILENINQDTPDCTEDSLKIHIHHLRRKLKSAAGKEYISAVWGIGFMLHEKS